MLKESDHKIIKRYAYLLNDQRDKIKIKTNDDFEHFLERLLTQQEKGRLHFLLTDIIPNMSEQNINNLLEEYDLTQEQFFLNRRV